MIDTVLWLLPVALVSASAYPVLRHSVFSEKWRPPSSLMTLLGLIAVLMLLARRIMLGSWLSAAFTLFSVAAMVYAYRVAVHAEASHRRFREAREQGG
jgi:hypothetical protein